jgi:hypothetical protein
MEAALKAAGVPVTMHGEAVKWFDRYLRRP